MKGKNFWVKGILLFVALVAVTAVIVAVMRGGLDGGSPRTSGEPTFLKQFVISGGPIVWFVLLPMSLIAVSLTVEYGLSIRRKKLLPSGIGGSIVRLVREYGYERLDEKIGRGRDFVSTATLKALRQGRGDWFRMRSAFAESLQDQAWTLLRRIEWVNLIGNVSPMVGLFGTVFGMIKLFNAIVTAGGQPQPAQLAEGISVALVTTFWGLFIAIPALAIYGVFRNRIETLASDAVVEAEDIIPQIRRSMVKNKAKKDERGEQEKSRNGKLSNKSSKKSAGVSL